MEGHLLMSAKERRCKSVFDRIAAGEDFRFIGGKARQHFILFRFSSQIRFDVQSGP